MLAQIEHDELAAAVLLTPSAAVAQKVSKEINQPRIISLRGRMIARRAEITKWTAKDINAEPDKIGLDGSPTKVVRIFTPSARPGGRMLTGTSEDCVRELVDQLTIVLAARKKGQHGIIHQGS